MKRVIDNNNEYRMDSIEELIEYMWLRPGVTCLNVDIFVDDGGSYLRHNHELLLFVRNGYKKEIDEFIPVRISTNPYLLDKTININISSDDIIAVYGFIVANRCLLHALANKAISQIDFVEQIIQTNMDNKSPNRIIGAIIGDVVGSTFEFVDKIPAKFKLFRNTCTFTDDTVLTVAIADALLHNKTFADAICDWGNRYTYAGFGGSFREWKKRRKKDPNATNNSKGNGCGMRVSPVGFFANSIDEAMTLAKESALLTHNSPEGIAGAQAIAVAVFMAKEKTSKEAIKGFIEKNFGYNLNMSNDDVRKFIAGLDSAGNTHREREWAENTCPVAITAFLNSCGYEETIRTAISYGGDVDTIACMAGGIAAAYYGVPLDIIDGVAPYLPQDIIDVVNKFDGLALVNRNTPSQIDRWAKNGHVLVYGSGKDFAGETKSGSLLRDNEPVGYIANRRFGSKHQLEGMAGNSYAIPAVGVTLEEIDKGVERFTAFVNEHPNLTFLITNIGCSKKAGFTPAEIAPMFSCIADNANVMLPKEFREVIEKI